MSSGKRRFAMTPDSGLVRRRAPGDVLSGEKAQAVEASMSRSLWINRAATSFFSPEARVIGLVAA